MKKFDLELAVGFFMIIGIICLGYLSIKLGKMEVFGDEGYEIHAIFSNSGGLKSGSSVVIAGVEVGRVKRVVLDDYQAKIFLNLPLNLKIQEDAIASIKTKGLIGEKYVEITPGGADELIKPGGRIRDTQSAIDIEELISNYVFGKI
ncbi:MAG: outer membrane lipid asymmetry maintenance protein MlaD [Desulfobacteraceae bacterium]|jgi:phospholipid/cholesterol/gamma-HCH transport system substrate-binding protein|uniref:Outer membrane lipid asymmetry maintenance protein MlaD n=1 Tax=Candidatus Desulfacyla euxinica TaxID=2841693 RepID=A0A8J6N5C1_9DELT|nr:outer membrane lipid asymmetry maintenance protein MlaD [Candidatus Desulfacyla euxinica]MBL6978576.1 outer membrane lipid asymmetry maintenance protein MlaD [Desulfobacteraceae bacterium]MBW2203305.1 outer membrane lipid asymmetry maintenance protein MlaD [Deltaproteobacteria bacterium]HIJ58893.1 outer membrane lipid asymmetry maintenance protein MlaD [Deltaproteobacteria bacterium]